MNNSASTLIIPVETQVREMDAKILLSCIAAERGFPVIMGSRAFLHFQVASIPRGVYLAKSMRSLSIRMFKILRQLGHEIVAWDEEGLLREPDEEYYRWRLSPITIRQISHLIAWGPDDARVFRDYPGYSGTPIHITGNPRLDLLRPELRDFYQPHVTKIRDRYGDFILVNTNFSKVNHFYTDLSELKRAVEMTESGGAHPYDVGKGHHKLALFKHFQEMLPSLCESLIDQTVVLRPHPAENHTPWLDIAERCPNLRVDNEGNVFPWLMAAKAVVANGCTTMVEGAVLDTPTVSFQPVTAQEYDFELPHAVSHPASSIDELCSTMSDIVAGKLGPLEYSARRQVLDQHIAALDGTLATERLVDVLENAKYDRQRPPAVPMGQFIGAWLHTKARTTAKRINMRRPGHRNNLAYHTHRFPDTSVEEISARIAHFGQLLNRFDTIRVREHSKHIFWIYA